MRIESISVQLCKPGNSKSSFLSAFATIPSVDLALIVASKDKSRYLNSDTYYHLGFATFWTA